LSRVFIIQDARGESQLGEAALPLAVGGTEQGDIVVPGVPAAAVIAHIALAEGHAYIQPADDSMQLFHNHEVLSGSKWLKSGDEVQMGDTTLHWRVQGDQVFVSVRRRVAAATLVPPDQPPPSESPAIPPPKHATPDVATVPSAHRGQRKWRWAVLAVFVLLLLATAFVLLATPVTVTITPAPATQSLQGFPPAVSVGDRLLAFPGRYTVTASLEGYRPLQETVTVNRGGLQEFRLQLEALPGLVTIKLEPPVAYRVFVDATVVQTGADAITEIPGGNHLLRIETDRYLPVTERVDIAGLGQAQQLAYRLQPGWATVQLNSQPTGAMVQLDDEQLGVTPLETEIMHGPHSLLLSLEKHKPVTVEQDFAAGSVVQLQDIVLQPADGKLALSSIPAGATISVDGVFYGTTPAALTLAAGKEHSVRLTRPGYQRVDKPVRLAPDEEQELEVSLPPEYGVVFVTAHPADATLVLDGKPAGKATRRLSLTTRAHTLEFRKPGFVSQRLTVTPRAGVSKNVDISLKTAAQGKAEKQAAATPATLTTTAGQVLHRVRPAGSFRMGASRREAGRRANESARLVQLTRPFYLGAKEVTNAEYQRYQAAHHSGRAEGVTLDGDRQPVVNISWDEAVRYCNWLSKADGLPAAYRESGGKMVPVVPATTGYRLPTEAEWVYVARKLGRQEMARYPWAGSFPPTGKAGNFADASIADTLANVVPDYNDGYRGSAPVGSFTARPAGFHDLGGNVAEWMHDFYAVYPGMAEQLVTDPAGPASGDHHVVRDSSWRQGSIGELRLSYRDYSRAPRPDLGFRLARTAQ
jgi:formylglycine-generating enzyme required for sulfatase activity